MTESKPAQDNFRRKAGQARFDAIRHRAAIVRQRMAVADDLAHELPESIQGSRLGIETLESIQVCQTRADRLAALRIGAIENANATALNAMRDMTLDLTLALNVFSGNAAGIYRSLKKAFPNLGKDGWFRLVAELRFAGVTLAMDAAWLSRETAELELIEAGGEAGTHAKRMKLMRDRRKAGFRMVTVAIHKQDVETFRRFGLLSGKDEPEAADLEEAAQSFLSGALATVAALDNAEYPEPPTKIARAMNPALALWPAGVWLDRLARFVVASFGNR